MSDLKTEYWMQKALEQAQIAASKDEVPIGAIVVHRDQIIGCGYNQREIQQNSLGHAELIALNQACHRLGQWRLIDCDLYVTIEPCPMCAGALINSRIRQVYFGASDPKAGAVVSLEHLLDNFQFNHRVLYQGGILSDQCQQIIQNFFQIIRSKRKNK